jgi:hypothetical protein
MTFKITSFWSQTMAAFTLLLFITGCGSSPRSNTLETKTDSELLQKTLAYHDPEGNWQKLKARLYLSSADTAGKANTFEIEIDNTSGYFAHISREAGKEVVKGMAGGKEFYLLDGKSDISEEDRKKYELTPEGVKWVHQFYGYLYGLPMKLTDESAKKADTSTGEELEGKTYRILRVTYDPAVGKDNWFFYLNTETYAMQAYKFNHGSPESGEYILLEQEEVVQGIKLPKVRKWYLNKDNKYLGTDTLLKGEALTAHRI